MSSTSLNSGSEPQLTYPTTAPSSDIERVLLSERARLEAEAGLATPVSHYKRPRERAFTRSERAHTTVLIGGLTLRHDRLVRAAWRGLGYNVESIPTPVKADFQAGKEYGNNGQCNPTYFTVGALVNHLKRLRDEQRIPTSVILDRYVFLTAGACGPCRFGMYEAEYRLALRNSGFDGFRVLLFQQGGGLDQAVNDAGLEMNLEFFLGMLNGMLIGDLLNEVAYHIRPYETVPGQTDQVIERCTQLCIEAAQGKLYPSRGGLSAKLLTQLTPISNPADIEKFLDQLLGSYYTECLRQCAELIDREIEVDYTRNKPVVKITGEFWAQTTEGDGNFNMFPFLEREGAEVLVEPVVTWLNYLLHQARALAGDRRGLANGTSEPDSVSGPRALFGRLKREFDYHKLRLLLTVAEKVILREYNRLRLALGGTAHAPANQLELERLGHPFYNSRSSGGEGHLEVAKNIYYSSKGLAHMVLSLKPFGCMPSTQSDGAQAAVIGRYPDMIYLPIETSGEGDINAHSRVQMALGEAKVKVKAEFQQTLESTGYSIEQIRRYVADHPELRRPLQALEHPEGTVSRASRFIRKVALLIDQEAAA